jgi:hypothetical protein
MEGFFWVLLKVLNWFFTGTVVIYVFDRDRSLHDWIEQAPFIGGYVMVSMFWPVIILQWWRFRK